MECILEKAIVECTLEKAARLNCEVHLPPRPSCHPLVHREGLPHHQTMPRVTGVCRENTLTNIFRSSCCILRASAPKVICTLLDCDTETDTMYVCLLRYLTQSVTWEHGCINNRPNVAEVIGALKIYPEQNSFKQDTPRHIDVERWLINLHLIMTGPRM